jgi:hypothetical protein
MNVYNSVNNIAKLLYTLAGIMGYVLFVYAHHVTDHGTFALPAPEVFFESSLRNIIAVFGGLYLLIVSPKLSGYATTKEGIGAVKKYSGWSFISFVKWEDITAIEYKRTIFGIALLIHSDKNIYKQKKYLYVNQSKKPFKEIVKTVRKKTKLPLADLSTSKPKGFQKNPRKR